MSDRLQERQCLNVFIVLQVVIVAESDKASCNTNLRILVLSFRAYNEV